MHFPTKSGHVVALTLVIAMLGVPARGSQIASDGFNPSFPIYATPFRTSPCLVSASPWSKSRRCRRGRGAGRLRNVRRGLDRQTRAPKRNKSRFNERRALLICK